MLATYFIFYTRHYIQKPKIFNYEKHIISHRSDSGNWMDPGILCVQRLRSYSYPDRAGGDRIAAGFDPQSLIHE